VKRLSIVVLAALIGSTVTAQAGDGCSDLWYIRNAIYRNAGYCFKTARAIATFGNAGCQYDNEAAVPLSDLQRRDINNIKAAERRLYCE
jgi:hypothetical protein